MAIYHLEAKVVSRGAGRSAVAASAYMSCSRLYNDYDGIQHDYTKKQGLVWQQVFLPEYAPQEWQDREKLWNAVEENEKAKDSRLAREFIAALPRELDRQAQISLIQEYVQEQFVAEGMCADAAIHDTDGQNPHAHILLTVRPLDEQGRWQYKTEKEYLCVRNGEERGFTAAEFKTAQAEGWEKQYPYYVDKKKKEYLPPSEAEARGLVRADKHPKSTRYGRQNPISERWNSEEQLVAWRAAWAEVSNRYLERAGREERIDHRSNAARGIDEIPTIHEGVTACAMERKVLVAEKKAMPIYHVKRHKVLTVRIAELTEDLEELRSKKALLLQKFEYAEDAGAEAFRKDIDTMEAGLKKLEAQEQKYSAELDKALDEYAELKAQTADFDPVELYEARQAIRPTQEKAAEQQLEDTMQEKLSLVMLLSVKQETSRLLREDAEDRQVRQIVLQRQRSQRQIQERHHKSKRQERER